MNDKLQVQIEELEIRNTKLQRIIARLASYEQMSTTKIDPLCSAVEAKARIEYAAKYAQNIKAKAMQG